MHVESLTWIALCPTHLERSLSLNVHSLENDPGHAPDHFGQMRIPGQISTRSFHWRQIPRQIGLLLAVNNSRFGVPGIRCMNGEAGLYEGFRVFSPCHSTRILRHSLFLFHTGRGMMDISARGRRHLSRSCQKIEVGSIWLVSGSLGCGGLPRGPIGYRIGMDRAFQLRLWQRRGGGNPEQDHYCQRPVPEIHSISPAP